MNISTKLTITTREFMREYLGLDYQEKKHLSHKQMLFLLEEKGIKWPRAVNIKNLHLEDIITGKYILVRGESSKKKKAQVIAYYSPVYKKIDQFLEKKTPQELLQIRKRILDEQNLEYDAFGMVVEKVDENLFQYDHVEITEKRSRNKHLSRSLHKARPWRK